MCSLLWIVINTIPFLCLIFIGLSISYFCFCRWWWWLAIFILVCQPPDSFFSVCMVCTHGLDHPSVVAVSTPGSQFQLRCCNKLLFSQRMWYFACMRNQLSNSWWYTFPDAKSLFSTNGSAFTKLEFLLTHMLWGSSDVICHLARSFLFFTAPPSLCPLLFFCLLLWLSLYLCLPCLNVVSWSNFFYPIMRL